MKNKKRQSNHNSPNFNVAICAFLLLLTVFLLFLANRPKLDAILIGEAEITLEFGQNYTDDGIRVLLGNKEVTAHITVDQPPMDAPGTYRIHYTAVYRNQQVTTHRTVRIVDTTPPVITLHTNPEYILEPGQTYEEEGYCAADLYDGDLTDKVERTVIGDEVHYRVCDSFGNVATAVRKLVYTDVQPPVITLNGDTTVTIPVGTEYVDPGYTATDVFDGDLTANVTRSGTFDVTVPGTYSLQYTVTDAAGNTATAVRTLIVTAPEVPVIPDKVICLTFDDGPGQYTPELLAVLEKYNAKATFFVMGTGHLEYLDEIAAAGHAIGIHTDTHQYEYIYSSESNFFEDFYAIHSKILAHCGIDTKISRFPGGSSNRTSKEYCPGIMTKLVASVEAKGFSYFDWNVDSGDASGITTATEVFQRVIAGIGSKDFAVVLQHDTKKFSVDAVELILQWGLDNGYTFLSLNENSPEVHHTVRN